MAPSVLLGRIRPQHKYWQFDDGTIWVCFGEDGCVWTKSFTPGRRVNFVDKLRRFLGMQ
jgi:hypothetical protein